MHTKLHSFIISTIALLACLSFAACANEDGTGISILGSGTTRQSVTSEELQFTTPESGDTIAIFSTEYGDFSAVLYDDIAVQACENFITLANQGFYDNTSIYRIISGFCVQGGLDAEGNASTIWSDNRYPIEVSDTLHHYAGALCTAATDGEASSPFYVVQATAADVSADMVTAMSDAGYRQEVIDAYSAAGGVPYLDYTDTVFGQIYDGMDVIDEIAALETDDTDAPIEEVLILSVTITTY